MTAGKDSWAEMTALWQGQKGVDPKALAKAVKRKTWSMRIMATLEVVVGILGVLVGIWMMALKPWSVVAGVGFYVLVFSIIGTGATLWARKGAWKTSKSGVAGQLRLSLERAHSGVKLALVNLWAILPAGLLVASVIFVRWDAILSADYGKKLEVAGLVAVGALALICTAIWGGWYKRRKEREIERLKTLLKDIESGA